jgi:CheY-like chemotaxis protein
MRLKYKILWFEDDADFFESLDHDGIKSHLDAQGFDLETERMSGDEDIQNVLKQAKKADLIVMDYGLEESHFGDQIIKEIRNGSINTQVVFYSARGIGDLRKLVLEKELDGIYYGSRNEISQDVLPVIDSSIRKVLDLENSRGLVMAELGELDLIMNRIIIAVHESSEEKRTFIRGKLKKRLSDQQETLAKVLEQFDSLTIEDLVDHLDSSMRCNTVKSICKNLKFDEHNEQLGSFVGEILFPRNCLGHGTPEETDDGLVFQHRDRKFCFNDESNTSLRNNFRKFRKQLEKLLEEIQEKLEA